MKRQLIRATATTIMGLSLMTGFAAADISTTGPNSTNTVHTTATRSTTVRNTNTVRLTNDNDQSARTGSAEVEHNTTGGDATSGDASNRNSLSATVAIDNTGSGCGCESQSSSSLPAQGTIHNTGPSSRNTITTNLRDTTTITNTNNLTVSNSNDQYAHSGSAEVSGNTTGGSATSGNASNTNSSTFNLSVSN